MESVWIVCAVKTKILNFFGLNVMIANHAPLLSDYVDKTYSFISDQLKNVNILISFEKKT